ncbi:MAG: ACT domain-containing protein [Clostridiales bacterium]|nr:ACT domain-containing protein [Clostridiales bacterium]
MKVNSKNISILATENVSIVTFNDIENSGDFLADIFKEVASGGVNIDMISQTPPKSDLLSFAFTFDDSSLANLLSIIAKIKSTHEQITPLVSSSNVKITISSPDMITSTGFASGVFAGLNKSRIRSLLITTSESDISVLVSSSDANNAIKAIEAELSK